MSFKKEKYVIVRNAISKDLLDFLDLEFEITKNAIYILAGLDSEKEEDKFALHDELVEKCYACYSPLCFETLSFMLLPVVSKIVGKELAPTYSFARIYYKDAEMIIHQDRESCEYSVTMNISNDPEPWDIWFKTVRGKDKAITLHPGDMIVYRGTDLYHWRNPNPSERVMQAFLHYVDINGPYAKYKYDTRPYIALPGNMRKESESNEIVVLDPQKSIKPYVSVTTNKI